MEKAVLGVIFGNRPIFPRHLITKARDDIFTLFQKLEIEGIMLNEEETGSGDVESHADARKCAALFKANRDRIDGILVILPNFGSERAVADTLKLANLDVPILVQAYPDELDKLDPAHRRDAFCGKISVCNNLRQYGIPFSLTEKHVVQPMDDSFQDDLTRFLGICRVVKGLRTVRIGAVGARPADFNTVRYSEKILESNGISVTTLDLSEVIGQAERIDNTDTRLKNKLAEIQAYAQTDGVPSEKLVLMAKFAIVFSDWIEENELNATAIQCWSSMQTNFGINPCTVMSMMSESMKPSACEVDVTGALSMYAMQLASQSPSAIVDWNNNFGSDEDKCVFFHCGNWAKCFLPGVKVSTAPILGTTLGEENTYGALEGRTPPGPFTFGRLTTDDTQGKIRAYVGEGTFIDDPLSTFGSRAVANISGLTELMHFVCNNGFEHHVAINLSRCADILAEAFQTYLGWETYYHR